MSKERIDNAVDIKKPKTLEELYPFAGVPNYFRGHIKDHSITFRPLYPMISKAVPLRSKTIECTTEGVGSFFKLKDQINECPNLLYEDDELPIFLCTDVSD